MSTSTSESYATSVVTSTAGGGTAYRQVVVDTRAPLQVAPRVTEEETVEDDVTPKAKEETIEKEKMPTFALQSRKLAAISSRAAFPQMTRR